MHAGDKYFVLGTWCVDTGSSIGIISVTDRCTDRQLASTYIDKNVIYLVHSWEWSVKLVINFVLKIPLSKLHHCH